MQIFTIWKNMVTNKSIRDDVTQNQKAGTKSGTKLISNLYQMLIFVPPEKNGTIVLFLLHKTI